MKIDKPDGTQAPDRAHAGSMPAQVILGILVIGMGVLFLLDNLDIWDFHDVISFWPAVFIVLGTVKLLDTRSPNGVLIGSLLIFAGVAITLKRLGYLYFSWHTIWPLLLILLGGSVLYKAISARRHAGVPLKGALAGASGDSVVDITAILSGVERRVSSQAFRGGEITAIMGGCVLDLRSASIEGEAELNVFALCGGITLKCPPDWTIVMLGTPIMGGFEEKTAAPPDNAKRLVIRGHAIMGGVEVRN